MYRDLGVDSNRLEIQFEAQKFRFENWGTAVGFQQGRLVNGNDSALEDPQTRSAVERLFSDIKATCDKAQDTFTDPKLGPNGPSARTQAGSQQSTLARPKRSRFRDKVRCKAQVELLGKQVRKLHDLLPPNGAKDSRSPANATNYMDSMHPALPFPFGTRYPIIFRWPHG